MTESVVDYSEQPLAVEVDDVTMIFNMASESLTNLKEYFIKLAKHELFFEEFRALKHISFDIHRGEVVGLVGTNGSGKSTMLKTISGLVKPNKGQIIFDGKTINKIEPDKIVAMGIAHTPEGRMVFPDLTVETNLLAGAYTRGDRAGIREDIQKYYEKFPILGERKNQKAGLMSGGEQQMLAIARSLMSRPKLLMLDEPSLGLAPVVVDDVYRIIKDIAADGMTILLVEQNATRALNVADRAYILANGDIEMSGTAKELAENDDVRKAYLGV